MNTTIDLTGLLLGILDVLIGVIATFVVPHVVNWLKEKGLEKLAKVLVKNALTLFGSNAGKEKFEWVLQKITESKYGKYFDVERIKQAIQAGYVDMCAELDKEPSPAVETEK